MRTLKLALAALAVALCGCTAESAENLSVREAGQETNLGDGTVSTYARFDAAGIPVALGVSVSEAAMQSLPAAMSDNHHCFDRNGDGQVQADSECMATHERIIALPSGAARRADIPFKWVLFNWNPMGHIPPGIYDLRHFDVHFYMEPVENVMAIQSGSCGPEYVRCDQFELARKPLPPNYMPQDYQAFDAIAPAMGNHFLDVTSHELHGDKFTRTFVYGAYDGRMTFYEEMLTTEFMESRPDTCFSIKKAEAVATAGYYPTQSCTRWVEADKAYTVSLEGFEYREAAEPLPVAAAAGM